jgi:DNA-binding transcriptional MerR regulator
MEMNGDYFLSINDVSKRLDIPAHTLRYWEKQFPATIKPTTGAGGRRYYRMETVDLLGSIKDLLYDRGMTIAGVKKLIKEGKLPASVDMAIDFGKSGPTPATPAASAAPIQNMELFSHQSDIDQAVDLLERARAALQ